MKRVFVLLLVCLLLLTLVGCSLFHREKEVEMVVYIDKELTDAEARAVGTELNTIPEVTECKFIHREEAMAAFMENYEDPEAFIGIEADALQHRFQVTAKTAGADALAEQIEEIEGVDDVKVVQVSWFKRLMWNFTH